MTIVVTGGGSGGHITPILAVAHELKKLDPTGKVIYIGQKGDSLLDVPKKSPDIDKVYTIHSGKLRRYAGLGVKQALDIPTNVKNARDGFLILAGISQSSRILKKVKPDAIFVKGSLGVPVGISASRLHIPIVTHDSDAVAGLAHKIIDRWTTIHTTALPKEYYSYSPAKTEMVGVPISSKFKKVDHSLQEQYKKDLGLEKYKQILLITGGGLGAVTLNNASVAMLPELLRTNTELGVVHFVGRANESKVKEQYKQVLTDEELSRLRIESYSEDFHKFSGAADLIVTRAGATSLAEFAVQEKACILVPSPYLVGGHQVDNAKALAKGKAIKLINESELTGDSKVLLNAVRDLLASAHDRKELSDGLGKFAFPDAAKRLAAILIGLKSQ